MGGGDGYFAILVALAVRRLTGSDCIRAVSTDIWAPALDLQRENIRLNEAETFVEPMEGDMFEPLKDAGLFDTFDLAYFYPPQITREEGEESCVECGPDVSLYVDAKGKEIEDEGNTALADIFLRGVGEYMRISGKIGRNILLIGTDKALTNHYLTLGAYEVSAVLLTSNIGSELVEIHLHVFDTLLGGDEDNDDGGDFADGVAAGATKEEL